MVHTEKNREAFTLTITTIVRALQDEGKKEDRGKVTTQVYKIMTKLSRE